MSESSFVSDMPLHTSSVLMSSSNDLYRCTAGCNFHRTSF